NQWGFDVDHRGIKFATGAADDERILKLAVVMDAVSTEDGLRMHGRVGSPKIPEQADVDSLVCERGHGVELGVGCVGRIGDYDRLGFAPVDHVGAFCATDHPLPERTAPM